MNLEFMKFLRKERKHRRRDRLRRHDNTLYCGMVNNNNNKKTKKLR